MENNQLLELYLRKVIEFCEIYDAFSIPAAMTVSYTHLDVYKRQGVGSILWCKSDLHRRRD